MNKKQMQRTHWAAGILILAHWLVTMPFSNVYLEGLWPPALTERSNLLWASGVIVLGAALGALMLALARGIRRTLRAADSPASRALQPAYWTILGYGVFIITVAVIAATTLEPEIYRALRTPLYTVTLVAGAVFVAAGALFLRRMSKDEVKAEWNGLFLRDE